MATETQEELMKLKIGNEEKVALKPAIVKVLKVEIQDVDVKGKKNKKVSCEVSHPDTSEPIHISAVKFENKGKLIVGGLWINLDSKNQIRKGSALAILLNSQKAETIEELQNKEITTTLDERNFLCFKAY